MTQILEQLFSNVNLTIKICALKSTPIENIVLCFIVNEDNVYNFFNIFFKLI
jgi:hypothetical protein